MLLYGISRFIVEIYRGDDRGVMLGVSTSQFVSLLDRAAGARHAAAPAAAGARRGADARDATDGPTDAGARSSADRRRRRRPRLDQFLARHLPDAVALADPAADPRRPRHVVATARRSRRSPLTPGLDIDVDAPGTDAADAGRRSAAARRSSTTTPTSSWSNKPAGHGRAPGGRAIAAARSSTRCCTTWRDSAASAATSGRASSIGSIAARRA